MQYVDIIHKFQLKILLMQYVDIKHKAQYKYCLCNMKTKGFHARRLQKDDQHLNTLKSDGTQRH